MSRRGRKRGPRGSGARKERHEPAPERQEAAALSRRAGWLASKWPILKPLLIFTGVMLAYYSIDFIVPLVGITVFDRYLEWIASVSAGIIRLFGDDARATGSLIISPTFSVRIVRGCDALEPTAAFVAAVAASPVVLRRKLPGLAVGVPTLLAINLVRVVSLFFIGAHFPNIFETMHYEIWQAAFIVLAVVFWAIWVQWATRGRAGGDHENPS